MSGGSWPTQRHIQHMPKVMTVPGPSGLFYWDCSCGLTFSTPLGMLTHMAYPAQEQPPMPRTYEELPMVGPIGEPEEVIG